MMALYESITSKVWLPKGGDSELSHSYHWKAKEMSTLINYIGLYTNTISDYNDKGGMGGGHEPENHFLCLMMTVFS